MYKLLLSMRYLRTRFIALASVVSVTLGVATLIVVNSVMNGFSNEMKSRLHGILADLCVNASSQDGNPDTEQTMQRIRELCGDKIVTIEGLSPNATHPIQKAWAALDVPQCGYCQSGQIMAAAALLKK